MGDVLAFFDREHSVNGPTEAINGRLETLRGIVLEFRNLDNYITRSLLYADGFRRAIQTHFQHMPLHTKIGKARQPAIR